MLTVWTGVWGAKYPDYYAQRMQREVAENLGYAHQFKCLSDRKIDGVETVPLPDAWESWWPKISLFKPGFSPGLNMWIDADCVVTGSLHVFCVSESEFVFNILKNWAQSGWGGCQSSLMVWREDENSQQIYNRFDYEVDSKRLHGDQEFITELRDAGLLKVEHIPPDLTASYKYHCREGLPKNCRVVVFHGKPDPHEVKASWFQW